MQGKLVVNRSARAGDSAATAMPAFVRIGDSRPFRLQFQNKAGAVLNTAPAGGAVTAVQTAFGLDYCRIFFQALINLLE